MQTVHDQCGCFTNYWTGGKIKRKRNKEKGTLKRVLEISKPALLMGSIIQVKTMENKLVEKSVIQ